MFNPNLTDDLRNVMNGTYRITSYKVLGAMLALDRFTANSLSHFAAVNLNTVYTVLNRNKSLLDEVDGGQTTQRGGQTKLYRIKPEKIDELRTELQGLFDQIKVLPTAKNEVLTAPPIPLSLRVAEDALLRLFCRSESTEERLRLLELADLNMKDGQSEMETLSINDEEAARSQINPLQSALSRLEALKLLSEAELSLERGNSEEDLDLLALLEKMVKAFNALSEFDNSNAAAFGKRLINSPLMRAVVVSGLKDQSAAFEHLPRYLSGLRTIDPSRAIAPGGLGFKTVGGQPKVRNAIAVMTVPGKNLKEEYIIYGFNEGITQNLSLAGNRLIVKAMNRSALGKSRANLSEEARSIAHRLNVDTVLMNKLDRRGKNMHCRSTLFDIVNDSPIWSHTYASNESELFGVQENISKAVSENLHIELTALERRLLTRRATDDGEAYQLYLKGRYYWSLWTLDGVKKSIEFFNKALDKDPCYGLAHAGLADGYNMLVYSGESTPRECFTKAKAEAIEALEIDDSLAEAYTSLAYSRARYYWKWKEAEKGYQTAIGLNPNYTIARQWYAEYLAAFERFDEALQEINVAYELEPFSPIVNVTRGSIFYLTRQYDQAVEQFEEMLKLDPTYVRAHSRLGGVYVQQGMYAKAIYHLLKSLQLSGKNPRELAMLGYAFAVSGDSAEAERILNEISGLSQQRYVSQYDASLVYAGLGDSDQALERLKKAYDDKDPWMVFLNVDPRLDSLRNHPEFEEIVKRVGLVSREKVSDTNPDADTFITGNRPAIGVGREQKRSPKIVEKHALVKS